MGIKVGVLGSGDVGQALAKGFIKNGYDVMIGTGNVEKYDELNEKTNGNARVGGFAETAAFGDIVVLAVKGIAAESVIEKAGVEKFSGKVIIDASNPIAAEPPVDGVLQYFIAPNESLMERLQKLAPDAKFVKCFSCVGSPFMIDPNFNGSKPTMFICGNDDEAKKMVVEILQKFGWEHEDMGTAVAARAIEPLAMLWCIRGFRTNNWAHAFKLLRL